MCSSDLFLARYRFPRPLALTAVLLLSCVGHLFIAFGVPQSLYAASVIIGFCFGAQWPLLFSIISEVFGLKYYSTLFNFGSAASPLGAYVLNVRIAAQDDIRRGFGALESVRGDNSISRCRNNLFGENFWWKGCREGDRPRYTN